MTFLILDGPKKLEQLTLVFSLYTNAGVHNVDLYMISLKFGNNLDFSFSIREFDGIGKEVEEHLL